MHWISLSPAPFLYENIKNTFFLKMRCRYSLPPHSLQWLLVPITPWKIFTNDFHVVKFNLSLCCSTMIKMWETVEHSFYLLGFETTTLFSSYFTCHLHFLGFLPSFKHWKDPRLSLWISSSFVHTYSFDDLIYTQDFQYHLYLVATILILSAWTSPWTTVHAMVYLTCLLGHHISISNLTNT